MSERIEACPECGLHPYDFDVDEYRAELDRVEAQRNELRAKLEQAEQHIKGLEQALAADEGRLLEAGQREKEQARRFNASIVAHHDIANLSAEAIRESIGGPCQICACAQAALAVPEPAPEPPPEEQQP